MLGLLLLPFAAPAATAAPLVACWTTDAALFLTLSITLGAQLPSFTYRAEEDTLLSGFC